MNAFCWPDPFQTWSAVDETVKHRLEGCRRHSRIEAKRRGCWVKYFWCLFFLYRHFSKPKHRYKQTPWMVKQKKLETLTWTLWKSKAPGRIPTLITLYQKNLKSQVVLRNLRLLNLTVSILSVTEERLTQCPSPVPTSLAEATQAGKSTERT